MVGFCYKLESSLSGHLLTLSSHGGEREAGEKVRGFGEGNKLSGVSFYKDRKLRSWHLVASLHGKLLGKQ